MEKDKNDYPCPWCNDTGYLKNNKPCYPCWEEVGEDPPSVFDDCDPGDFT